MRLSSRGRQRVCGLGLALQFGLTLVAVVAARAGLAPSRVVIALAVSFVPYGLTLWSAAGAFERHTAERVALAGLLTFGFALVVAPPVLSDDVYRYVWEGRVWLSGHNPYVLAPADLSLSHLRDEVWTGINNKALASIYPPLSQGLFIALAVVGGGVASVKLVALLGHAATVFAIARLTPDPRAPLVIALNPLLLSQGALDGHLDLLTGLAVLVAASALAARRPRVAVVATWAAVGLKLVGAAIAPLFLRKPRVLVAVLAGAAVLAWPMLHFRPSADAASGPIQFAVRWRGNDSVYGLVEAVARSMLDPEAAAIASRTAMVLAVLCLGFVLEWKRVPPVRAARLILWSVLLLSPQVHPWYLAWLLPLEVACGRWSGFVWSASILVAFAPLDRWVEEGVWHMPGRLVAIEYSTVALALIAEHVWTAGKAKEAQISNDSEG